MSHRDTERSLERHPAYLSALERHVPIGMSPQFDRVAADEREVDVPSEAEKEAFDEREEADRFDGGRLS